MNEQITLQTLLQKKLLETQVKNKSFSVRAFAKKLGVGSGPLTEILKGQRRVSRRIAVQIADNLGLDPSERTHLLKDYPEKLKRNSKLSPNRNHYLMENMKLTSEQYKAISDWVHYGILSLMNTSSFKSDPGWIAKRLKIDEETAWGALMRLQRLGLIRKDDAGEWHRVASRINSTDDVLDLSLQRAHLNDMEMAKEKLLNTKVSLRDFSSFTFPTDPSLLARAKEILRKAQDDLADLMKEGDPQEVYRVCTYLFPLTDIEHGVKE